MAAIDRDRTEAWSKAGLGRDDRVVPRVDRKDTGLRIERPGEGLDVGAATGGNVAVWRQEPAEEVAGLDNRGRRGTRGEFAAVAECPRDGRGGRPEQQEVGDAPSELRGDRPAARIRSSSLRQ